MSSVQSSTCFSRVSLTGCSLQRVKGQQVYWHACGLIESRITARRLRFAREIWGIVEEEGEVKVCHVIVRRLCLSYSFECGSPALDADATPYRAPSRLINEVQVAIWRFRIPCRAWDSAPDRRKLPNVGQRCCTASFFITGPSKGR